MGVSKFMGPTPKVGLTSLFALPIENTPIGSITFSFGKSNSMHQHATQRPAALALSKV